jgi:hypothetical protein
MTDSSATSPTEQPRDSELFTVRLWREQIDDHFEWRGKVQRIATNEVRYFREWEMLDACIQEMLTSS